MPFFAEEFGFVAGFAFFFAAGFVFVGFFGVFFSVPGFAEGGVAGGGGGWFAHGWWFRLVGFDLWNIEMGVSRKLDVQKKAD